MLSTLLLLPLVGAILVALLPVLDPALIRRITLMATMVVAAFAWSLLVYFDPAVADIQFYEVHAWHDRLGSSFSLGVDGFSLPLILLATLLMPVAVVASGTVKQGAKFYFSLLLLLETAMLGVFMARDWSLFYVFWELTLIPLFFLIDRLGGQNRQRRQKAALNFVLYTMGGSVFMLLAILLLYDAVPTHSFSMSAIAEASPGLPVATQVWIFLGLLIGFGVKMPIFPLHGWLPLAHVEAPSAVSILLSGILLKMGSYGLLRAVETLPGAALLLQSLLVTLAFVSMIYGGVLAWRSRDLKEMIAYSSISHMGVVLLGIAALNPAGFAGATMQMIAHGLVAGALFFLVGLLYERTHTRDIGDYASLVRTMPRFAFFMVLALTAAVGLPGTAGFIAELHALLGGFARWGLWMVVLSLSLLISAAYAFRTVGRLFTGPVSATMKSVPDLSRTEMTAASALAFGIVAIGLFPAPALNLVGASVARLAQYFGA
ncbi:MAG: NADH-quinone oxidoreductase subunit M [Gammaproteobacteria bacterium]|nr:NADH-quinone oxidoreductase subunit M [Rhodocyclaceae bacterium]MBU3908392.1 NADH-quinone oxidoreductase subunit M [Gammaproteobacteria bacterium]MBU3988612.1 NADH-quinone oxidoreductase subunit M [Gammaproteobacteria bacterium]MBU4004102.1 NADH-quinone oxidoreductase subunit M [Gammaproteobacteria bacterium]MBU4020349.1 NADH-quinone oxidoreductase subunit M [Gammaproteobacteria bacterium]